MNGHGLEHPGRWKNVNSAPGDTFLTMPMMSHRAEPHCPHCKGILIRTKADAARCLKCSKSFTERDGVNVKAVG